MQAARQPLDTLAPLQNSLAALRVAIGALPPGAERAGLEDDVEWLAGQTARTDPREVTTEYVSALARAASLLRSRPRPEAIADIAADLRAKREHCRALQIGMGGTVTLKIDTRRGASSVRDWQVLYLLKIYEWVPDAPPGQFPRLSTPTETTLEPGRYWVWARDPATGRVSDRVLVTAAGRKELLVDVVVP